LIPNAIFSSSCEEFLDNHSFSRANSCQHISRSATEEPPHSHASAEQHSRKTATDNSSAESNVQHLHAIALPAAVDEAVCVVCAREFPAFWHRDFEEIAQWLPAFAHLILEQVLRRHHRADLGVVFVEAAFAVLFKVAFPELGPEFCLKMLVSHAVQKRVIHWKTYCLA
jgi:hypothetical protein